MQLPLTNEAMRTCLDAYEMAEEQASRTLGICGNGDERWIEDALAAPEARVLGKWTGPRAQSEAVECLRELIRRRVVNAVAGALILSGAAQ